MPEERDYKVIAALSPDAEVQKYADLGVHAATRPESAVEAAVACAGNGVVIGACVAVPVGNWTICAVEEDPRPRFKARRVAELPSAGDEPKPRNQGDLTGAAEPGS